MNETERCRSIAERFEIEGTPLSAAPYGEGHINVTYLLVTDIRRYILQKMNTRVFPDSDALMGNICAVTEYLRERGVETLRVVPTREGASYLREEGECWRMYDFIEGTVTYQTAPNLSIFRNSGRAFGEFQNALDGFRAERLQAVLPRFHDTPKRFSDFCAALSADPLGRAKSCRAEIEQFLSREASYGLAMAELKSGGLPLRVTHNDTKLNNILMDEETGLGRAVIDLDTVMPGSMIFDFGDSIRFGASTAAEDERDVSRVHFSLTLFRAYAEGFCGAVRESVTARERELLSYGAYLMTAECGMRFLTDYLLGDVYFATKYETHNLVRARTQIKLMCEMEEALPQMNAVIGELLEK